MPLFLVKEIGILGPWSQFGSPEPHYPYVAVFMFLFGTAVLAAVSLATAAPDYDRIAQYTVTVDVFEEDLRNLGLPWYEDFRYQAVELTLLMAGTVLYFW